MRKRKRILGSDNKEFPLSTMIDVVFLLLIYFIVTQKPIIEETMIDTAHPGPPPPNTEIPPIDPNPVRIDVFKEKGDFYRLNGKALKNEILFNYLKETANRDPEQQILINCGSNATHQKLVKLLDECAAVDLKNLNIINDETRPLEK